MVCCIPNIGTYLLVVNLLILFSSHFLTSALQCHIVLLGPNGCLDLIENCAVLKEAGKCMTDPVFMMKNCADSCDACFIEQGKARW